MCTETKFKREHLSALDLNYFTIVRFTVEFFLSMMFSMTIQTTYDVVCQWVHIMTNDAPCWKSVYEPKKLELNSHLGK